MKSKKGAEESSLSFLIGIIVFLMIMAPLIIIGYRSCAEQEGVTECYDNMVKVIKK